jgi:hypothetical protein
MNPTDPKRKFFWELMNSAGYCIIEKGDFTKFAEDHKLSEEDQENVQKYIINLIKQKELYINCAEFIGLNNTSGYDNVLPELLNARQEAEVFRPSLEAMLKKWRVTQEPSEGEEKPEAFPTETTESSSPREEQAQDKDQPENNNKTEQQ